jgi:hypothetical protein
MHFIVPTGVFANWMENSGFEHGGATGDVLFVSILLHLNIQLLSDKIGQFGK